MTIDFTGPAQKAFALLARVDLKTRGSTLSPASPQGYSDFYNGTDVTWLAPTRALALFQPNAKKSADRWEITDMPTWNNGSALDSDWAEFRTLPLPRATIRRNA